MSDQGEVIGKEKALQQNRNGDGPGKRESKSCTSPDLNCFHISNFICRSVRLAVSMPGSLNSLHIFEHTKLSATRSLSMPFPPTLPPMP